MLSPAVVDVEIIVDCIIMLSSEMDVTFFGLRRGFFQLAKRLTEIKRLSGRITIMNTVYETTKESLKRIGELGSGTCGVVYKARFEQTGTIMAVKVRLDTFNDFSKRRRSTQHLIKKSSKLQCRQIGQSARQVPVLSLRCRFFVFRKWP